MSFLKDKKFFLYGITDKRERMDYVMEAELMALGGIDVVQFRAKELTKREYYETAATMKKILDKYNTPLIINDHLDVAISIDASGIHIGQDDLPITAIKNILEKCGRKNFIIGVSTHSIEEAIKAAQCGASYISIGPIFYTPAKKQYQPLGEEIIPLVKEKISPAIPVIAIGGINEENISSIISLGADGAAMIRGILDSENIVEKIKSIRKILMDYVS
jgi:thiamine-phosphate pyrophosphorylase